MPNENIPPLRDDNKGANASIANAKTQLLRRAGTPVWAPQPNEAWVTASVVGDSNTNKIQVATSSGETMEVSVDQVELNTMSAQQAAKVEDLTKLPNLHEPGLLLTLHERFKLNEIYTYTGPILLAVNPFKRLPNLYSDKLLKRYLDADVGDDLPPHAWRIADRAFKFMAEDAGKNQSILVSGESGAGKTETTKIVMRYLTVVSHSAGSPTDASHVISDRVLQLNPLIEAFGNAKTSRNDNSSRFGKLIQLKFDSISGKLSGAWVDTYLLEKARICSQASGERNYHIFYELAAGASSQEKSRWGLSDLRDFKYTNQSGTFTRNDIGDADQFKDTLKAMDIVGLTPIEKDFVFSTVMAVMHLGNITFEPAKKTVERKGITSVEDGSIPCKSGASGKALEMCAQLMSVDVSALAEALTTKKVNVGFGANTFASGLTNALGLSETFTKHFNIQQAGEARDALAMTVYDRLFSWIVWRVNDAIRLASQSGASGKDDGNFITFGGGGGGGGGRSQVKENRRGSALTVASVAGGRTRAPTDINAPGWGGGGGGRARAPTLQEQERMDPTDRSFLYDFTIGCLDIFGFEVFQRNSFEQLCINYANENLQQQFNEFVFELEQKVYQGEGIDWTYVSFPDNKPTLEMIEARPIGLLSLIDEECLYPQGDDKTLANKLYNNLPKKFPRFAADQKDRINRKFVIHHFAGDVKYDVDGMYAKNKNELHQELVDVVRSSKRKEFVSLMPSDATQAALGLDSKKANNGEGSSLMVHMEELRQADDRHAKKQGQGGGATKLQQKTVGAVFKQQLALAMAHIRASQPHYVRCLKPNDMNKPDILMRNRTVEQLRYSGVLEVVKVARAGYPTRFRILEFVKRYYPLLSSIEGKPLPPPGPALAAASPADHKKMAEKIVNTAQLVFGEDYQIGKTKVFLRPATFTRLEIIKADRLRMHVVRIQKIARGYIVRRKYRSRQKSATTIQAFFRGYRQRKKVAKWRRERRAAKLIQKHVRGYLVRVKYDPIFNKRADAAWVIHRAMRRKIMQVRLKTLREKSVQERAAVMLQGLARVIKAQKVANSLYVAKVTDMAATSIQGLAKIMQAKREKKLLEQKRMEERLPDGAQFIWWLGPLIIIFLLANPMILVGLTVLGISMAVGGGFVLDQQRRNESTERRMRYAKMMMADYNNEDVLYLGPSRDRMPSNGKASRPLPNPPSMKGKSTSTNKATTKKRTANGN